MINNLALDATGDLLEAKEQIQEVTGVDAIAQGVTTDLRFFLGEHWLDTSLGFPYYETVFIKGIDLTFVKTLLIDKILERDEVIEVTNFIMNYDNSIRKLAVVFSALTTEGAISDQEVIISL